MILTTFNVVERADFQWEVQELQKLPCGLHRASLERAPELLPEMADFFASAPVDIPEEWEIDVKIHMLMPRQYPCIPNWHCDNVKRDAAGKLEYGFVDTDCPPMMLWVSNQPVTLFLDRPLEIAHVPASHGEVHEIVESKLAAGEIDVKPVPAQTWVSMSRRAVHRGQASENNCWRVFARLTHKSILTERPVISEIRRHCQVYLPQDFHW